MQMWPWLCIEPDRIGDAKLPDKGQSGKIEGHVFRRQAWLAGKAGVEFGYMAAPAVLCSNAALTSKRLAYL